MTDDGLTRWHPAFLELGPTLDACAARYRRFCRGYQPPPKQRSAWSSHWGDRLVAGVRPAGRGGQPELAGQVALPWAGVGAPLPQGRCQVSSGAELRAVAERFVRANRPARWPPPG